MSIIIEVGVDIPLFVPDFLDVALFFSLFPGLSVHESLLRVFDLIVNIIFEVEFDFFPLVLLLVHLFFLILLVQILQLFVE